ncbi:phosphonate ABC transporter ATP-binding protein [Propylenella binzhouense]|uniref:Phosphonate ABC transporter ATP-binding protein n=1 Tax=Propylenella binzhouense TaxID=2555902 RepID=A0A964WUC8_9HYPH|nr:phosphonate ABC transporter ATP-binding protein [Propylenella binzhouense]MYZ48982.1 phosphonate ABC transporter ATP-binding protein [Propylenella binzhouense]
MPALSVERLSKRFGRTYALSEIGFTVEPGEMVALIGASGSGKSTLIRHIAGLERGNGGNGRITVEGRVMQQGGKLSPEARAIRRHIGVVFQQFNLIGRLPVLTNVLIGCLGRVPAWRGTLGWFARSEQETAVRALMRVGIAETARRRASTLSGGQQQRAAIARALVQGAKLLIADEPIASLDPASAKRVMEALADINRVDGITVIVSLHQVDYARLFCPRTIALRAGEIVYDGPSEVLTDAFLREIYGEASEELVLAGTPAAQKRPRPVAVPMAQALATT